MLLCSDLKLWKSTKSLLRNYENEEDGCIIIDDMILNKPYTKENDIVCWHYDHTVSRSIKGICMLNFHYTDISGISIPLAWGVHSELFHSQKQYPIFVSISP